MTFHLEGPWLSTTGKKKGKQKFRTADAARKSAQLKENWNELLSKYETKPAKKETMKPLSFKPTYRGSDTPKIPSKGDSSGVAAAKPIQTYTGTKMIGIGQLHKSNAVPVFSSEDAADIARMRR